MSALLDHTDPRLGLSVGPAAPNDPMTRVALRLLGDTLARIGDGLLAAPAVGVPVRIIAVRKGDITSFFLNPGLVSLGSIELSRAETSPQTGSIRRNVQRARQLVLCGTDLSGVPQQAEFTEELSVQAQQAFELLDSTAPFGWLTPFHRALLADRDGARRSLYEAVNKGLYAAALQRAGGEPGITFCAENTVALHPDTGGAALARIDALDPLCPVDQCHRVILSVMAALPDCKSALFTDPGQSDLLAAALLLFEGFVAHLAASTPSWPFAALGQLGLGASICRHDLSLDAFAPLAGQLPALGCIVMDRRKGSEKPWPSGALLRNMARALSGSGALICVAGHPDPAVEDSLQAAFPALYAIAPNEESIIYVAVKTPLDSGAAKARLVRLANQTGESYFKALLTIPWYHLRKDGKRDAQ